MEQSPCAGIVSREWKRTPFPIQSSIRCPFCYIGGLQPIPEFDPVGIQWGDIGNRCIYIGIYDQKGFKLFVINTLFKKINLHHHFASCHHPGNPVRRNHFTKYLVFLHLYTILLQGSVCFLKEVKWHQWEIQRDVPHLEETRFLLFLHIFASSYQLPSGRKYYGIKREIQKKEHPQWKWETHFFLPQLREEVMIWRHKSGSILLWKNWYYSFVIIQSTNDMLQIQLGTIPFISETCSKMKTLRFWSRVFYSNSNHTLKPALAYTKRQVFYSN